MLKRINKVTLFLILTFFINWTLILIFVLTGNEWNSPTGQIIAVIYMFIPALVVMLIDKVVYKEQIKKKYAIHFNFNKWLWIGWIFMPVVAFLSLGIALLFPEVSYSPEMQGLYERLSDTVSPERLETAKKAAEELPVHPIWVSLLQGLFAGITINALFAFGEELGWRGFLVYHFRSFSFIKATFTIGAIWGIWHMPIILLGHNYPQHPTIGVFMMVIWCILLTVPLLYFRLKSGTVISAAVIHGTLNGVYGISIMLIAGGNDLTTGLSGLSGFISLILLSTALFVLDKYILKENIMSSKLKPE